MEHAAFTGGGGGGGGTLLAGKGKRHLPNQLCQA